MIKKTKDSLVLSCTYHIRPNKVIYYVDYAIGSLHVLVDNVDVIVKVDPSIHVRYEEPIGRVSSV